MKKVKKVTKAHLFDRVRYDKYKELISTRLKLEEVGCSELLRAYGVIVYCCI